ncbi:coat protein F [Orenia metallireducens]|uniref:Coat protein F n=1 Tax=Orenia metallireducens TaxID=1413210 RepID=A0A1C0ACC1_9FIRM|nr:spore coat protein [Orenia metallireducens]OCL28018.1 coat protein F [Orenia metallireducens]
MNKEYGAHEIMEMHEVLTDTINGINQFELYRPHVKDSQLGSILDNQIQFMIKEYNNMVQAMNQRGMNQRLPYNNQMNSNPKYGLRNPQPESPNTSINQLNDRDIASGMLSCHKSSAIMRTIGALECADPQLRKMVQQGSMNCMDQAYEVWQFMNERGFYQVPTLKDTTTDTMVHSYTPANMNNNMNMQLQPQAQAQPTMQ